MGITKSQFVKDSYEIKALNPLTKKQAELKIREITSQLYLFGNNEKEIAEIDDVIRRLYGGKITPERAVVEATEILEVKNSYANLYKSFFNIFNIF